jgi:hypothetical protein
VRTAKVYRRGYEDVLLQLYDSSSRLLRYQLPIMPLNQWFARLGSKPSLPSPIFKSTNPSGYTSVDVTPQFFNVKNARRRGKQFFLTTVAGLETFTDKFSI